MPKSESFPIAQIYVPVKRKGTVNPQVVTELAESILQIGQQTPILVRRDGDRLVLVEGLHRLEACKALGEETIIGCVVEAQAARAGTSSAYEAEAAALRQKADRLRTLRLEKQAAESLTTPAAAPPGGTTATRAKEKPGRSGSAPSKPATLSQWLADRARDGVRH